MARSRDSLQLEALLRSCKRPNPVSSAIICPHSFHRDKLAEYSDTLQEIFGNPVTIYNSEEDYIAGFTGDLLVETAIELGGEVACQGI